MSGEDGFATADIPAREGPAAGALATAWARIYTLGLDPGARDERLAELESDLFEQQQDAHTQARGSLALNLAILLRVVMGMAADVSWRLEAARPGTTLRGLAARGVSGAAWTVHRGMPGVTWLLAGAYAVIGFLLLVTLPASGDQPASERAGGGVMLLLTGALIAGGLLLGGRRRKTAVVLTIVGSAPFALAFSGTVVVPAASVIAIASAVVKARSTRI